jgi:hypothetical protein
VFVTALSTSKFHAFRCSVPLATGIILAKFTTVTKTRGDTVGNGAVLGRTFRAIHLSARSCAPAIRLHQDSRQAKAYSQ